MPAPPPASAPKPESGDRPKACPSCGARFPADALFCSLDGSPLSASPGVIAAAAASDPYLGHEILGHIEIRQLVGIGAMGRVYRAFQRGIDRDVAVKVLHRELSSNQALVARFDREAKVASRLAHPNVVHVLLVGQLPDGAMYIVMEYLDGLSLQSALAAVDGAMPLPRALHVALQLCDAAGEGHGQGIVHRDLKPENVMLVRRADDADFVKVLDFGIARVHWGEQSMATAAGLIFGTARYISPEGAQGEQVGPAGDVYSIATMLYQMLSGRTPFNAEQTVALLVQQIHEPPLPLASIPRAAYVPEPIANVIMKNLAKKPADRAPDARAFGAALLEAAVSSGLSAQDVLGRPALRSGGRGTQPGAVQMPSMQRTRQLQLEPEMAARIGAVTAFETPAPSVAEASSRAPTKTEISDPEALPPGVATTKWTPSPQLATKLIGPDMPVPALKVAARIDQTVDDPNARPAIPARTVPLPTAVLPPQSALMPPAAAVRAASGLETAAPVSRATSRVGRSPAPASKPPSSVDATLAGDEVAPVPSARLQPQPTRLEKVGSWRGIAIAGLCVVAGLAGMATIAWKASQLGGAKRAAADSAARPPITVPATTIAPAVEPAPALPPLEISLPSGSKGTPSTAVAGARSLPGAAAAAAAAGSARVFVEASNPKPGIGQPVDFVARIAGPKSSRLDAARFVIAGPGIAPGTELPASDEGSGVFRATFTFLEGGRFQVDFNARVDGAPVRGNRVVVIGDAAPAPVAAPPPESPSPATAPPVATPPPAAAKPAPSNPNGGGGANAQWL